VKLETHRLKAFPYVAVEACGSCGHYLKSVDLRREPGAVPVVDELASLELDALAREKGFVKLEPNLAGF
jgi:formate dehydrogenase maturation protein FdhE